MRRKLKDDANIIVATITVASGISDTTFAANTSGNGIDTPQS